MRSGCVLGVLLLRDGLLSFSFDWGGFVGFNCLVTFSMLHLLRRLWLGRLSKLSIFKRISRISLWLSGLSLVSLRLSRLSRLLWNVLWLSVWLGLWSLWHNRLRWGLLWPVMRLWWSLWSSERIASPRIALWCRWLSWLSVWVALWYLW